jgi:sigma-B regulation protein RsbU (phosphoserine phosphatase)
MDIFEALKIAIRSEIDAQRMYTEFAEETSDAEAKSLFNYLVEYELTHQQLLEAERRALAAAHEGKQGRPSHWLRLLREELSNVPATDGNVGGDLAQMRLTLSAAESVAKILKNANEELSRRQVRYEQELAIAADVQRKLLPQELPQSTGLQIAASNTMARSVGGDYYDFAMNDRGQLALIVADSMGKGIPAALLMTTVRAIWRSCSAIAPKPPDQTLDMINRSVYADLKATEAFVTMFSALYDPATSSFRYSNAGHNPPLFRPALAPECRELDIGGTPVGIFPDSEFSSGEFRMREGDVVVIYTDGIVEAADKNDKLFGLEKLCSLVEQNHELGAEDIRNLILAEVDSHTSGSAQTDDITVMILKRV